MHLLKQNNIHGNNLTTATACTVVPHTGSKASVYAALLLVFFFMTLSGCGENDDTALNVDTTIPESSSWYVNTILDLSENLSVSPRVKFHHEDGRLHLAYYDAVPTIPEDIDNPVQYRVRYKAFNMNDLYSLNETNSINETVALLDTSGRSTEGLDISIAGGFPVIAYSVYKELIHVEGADLNNQGDVILGVRDDASGWQSEIFAYGYVDPSRNPVFTDGLAKNDLSVIGDDDGNAQLCYQFYYEGIDSYNYNYPDLRYISQPITNIAGNVNAVAELEETIEGNNYQNNAGLQHYDGGHCDLKVDNDGNQVAFYYNDWTETSSALDRGLRVARRIENEWQQIEWIDRDIEVIAISGVVKSNGLLAVAYTVKDGSHLFMDNSNFFSSLTIPYSIRYAEQIEIITEVENAEGEIEEVITYEWQTETINFNSIAGLYCSLDVDSSDNPVIVYFDDMNFTLNRFFCRIKISKRNENGVWDIDIINPEDVGLTNSTSPYEITPGTHNKYYIGKYNHMWVDNNDRVNICTYSTETKKVYMFVERPVN